MTLTRRHLITSGLAFAALPATTLNAATDPTLRTIPSTGVKVPAVGLGSWITFNVGNDPELLRASTEVIAAFLDEGGGMIDSSPMYGSSQDTIGHALEQLGRRDAVFATDKVWTGSMADGPEQIGATRDKWGVTRFELLQVHNLVEWRGHLDTLFEMKAAGQLGHVGITTSHGRRHREMERIMKDYPLDFVQLTYNLANRDAEARLLPLAREKGISVIANRPFERGALPRRLEGAPLPGVAAELGADNWAQLLLKFVLSHPGVTIAIPATTRVEHVRENKVAGRGPLPDAAQRREIVAHFQSL
ncbi:aldo/keto reductase [Roseovarius aestuariivivens]|uniref:aldo/keto reductase n=1 Tax=Roseovarius aestuariivivens TaxID=1888910 RepID=UPI0010820E03|nr:aldo/keto reductase [Roseovarius aestuariivivens]